MIVVDASVVLHVLLFSPQIRRRLARQRMAVSHLVDSELCHALRRLVRRGLIGPSQADPALERWVGMGLRRYGAVGLLDRIWELRDNLTAYDATYVAQAEALDCPLLTTDVRLARTPGVKCSITVLPR